MNHTASDVFNGVSVNAKDPGSGMTAAVVIYSLLVFASVLVLSPAERRRKKALKRQKAAELSTSNRDVPDEIEIQAPYIHYREAKSFLKDAKRSLRKGLKACAPVTIFESLPDSCSNFDPQKDDSLTHDEVESKEVLSFFSFFSIIIDPSGLFRQVEDNDIDLFDIGLGKLNARRNEIFANHLVPKIHNFTRHNLGIKFTAADSDDRSISTDSSEEDNLLEVLDQSANFEDATTEVEKSVRSPYLMSQTINPNIQRLIIPSSIVEAHKNISNLNDKVIRKARHDITNATPATLSLVLQKHNRDVASESSDNKSDSGSRYEPQQNVVWSRIYRPLRKIAHIELEARRFITLAAPMTLGDIFDAAFALLSLSIISNFLGVEEMVAYTMTVFMLELCMLFSNGIMDALYNALTHSVGAQNYELAGQYLQMAIMYSLSFAAPAFFLLSLFMDRIVSAFGFSDEAAAIAISFVRVQWAAELLDIVHEIFVVFLDVTGHARFSMVIQILRGSFSFCLVVFLTICGFSSLTQIAMMNVAVSWAMLCFHLVWTFNKGWLDPYLHGLVRTLGFKVSHMRY